MMGRVHCYWRHASLLPQSVMSPEALTPTGNTALANSIEHSQDDDSDPHPLTAAANMTHLTCPLCSSKGPELGKGGSSRGCSSLIGFLRALGWHWCRCGSELLSGAWTRAGEGDWVVDGMRYGLDVIGSEFIGRGYTWVGHGRTWLDTAGRGLDTLGHGMTWSGMAKTLHQVRCNENASVKFCAL